ncbi:MAG: T9SS type A sorting domain-containing protein, partial [Salibacteraceae bacterium]|nr:T9SS type A sorting domain-containing protein [Salibacteraceae bacterium]
NPSNGQFNLEAAGFNLAATTISIVDMRGNVLEVIRPTNSVFESVDIRQAAGVYYLMIEYNGKTSQQKIVLQ